MNGKNTNSSTALASTACDCYKANGRGIIFNRVWAIANHETFRIKPIREFVKKYLRNSDVSIDPFARDCEYATYTNDLNKETMAQYHMNADEFLQMLVNRGVEADLILFDPPYSRNQVKEMYGGMGLKYTVEDSQYFSTNWRKERDLINKLLKPDGCVLSFGWNSTGMSRARGYKIIEILMVCHGSAKYDTICIAEQRVGGKELNLFGEFAL